MRAAMDLSALKVGAHWRRGSPYRHLAPGGEAMRTVSPKFEALERLSRTQPPPHRRGLISRNRLISSEKSYGLGRKWLRSGSSSAAGLIFPDVRTT